MSATGLHTLVRRMCIHKCEHFCAGEAGAPLSRSPLAHFSSSSFRARLAMERGALLASARSLRGAPSMTPREEHAGLA